MAGVDLLRVAAEQHGHLIDDHLVDEIGQVVAVPGPDLQWAAIEHDPRRQPVAGFREPDRKQPGKGDIPVLKDVTAMDEFVRAGRCEVRHVLDGELHTIELALPSQFQILDGVQNQIIELSGAGAGQRYGLWHEPATQPTAAAITRPAAIGTPAAHGLSLRRRSADARMHSIGAPHPRKTRIRLTSRLVRQQARRCSRSGCANAAVATLTYVYAESTAVVGPLASFSEPHSYDLCELHGQRLTAPRGWEVVRHEVDPDAILPSTDDLLALADAVREAARPVPTVPEPPPPGSGRRGHLRAVPVLR